MNVKELVKKFGGQSLLAEKLGIGQSAIAYWVKKNAVPSKWHGQLLSLANSLGVDILAADLIAVDLSDGRITPSMSPVMEHNAQSNVFAQSAANGAQQFLFYTSGGGALKIQVLLGDETVWASQKGMAEIFDVSLPTINEHLKNIFESKELDLSTVIRNFLITADDGKDYNVNFYNLDAIISVGYRVNSYKATQFRRWATTVLKEYLVKGFAMDDERLKQGNQLFGKDYFDELLERIRKIRTSERMFWQKVTDLYSQCSSDYDKESPVSKQFFAQIQNKFHYAIHHHTAAELIKERADANKPNMGLVHFTNINKDGVVLKSDIIGKNFLSFEELDELDRLVENYLGAAELFAKRKIVMTMRDWVQKLDQFLLFNAYDVLDGYGRISSEAAKQHAYAEYEKFKIKQDENFKSDFDRLVTDAKIRRKLPKPPTAL
jgi:transcriptional regulator with XRE-family HTH domain